MLMIRSLTALGAAALALTAAAGPAAQAPQADEALIKKARAIHERVITADTHNDINVRNFTAETNYTQRLDTQVNLPKMVEGGLDVSFFIVYVGQGPLTPEGYANAYKQASEKFDAIHRLTKEIAPDKIELALTAADVRRIAKSGKKVAMIGIENGYPIGEDIKRVKEFYDRGGRYISLAHNGHSQLADSNTGEATGEWMHNGLSELGKQVIAEANRLGMMVDISHPSKQANLQAIALSKAPVIASHSAARALADHSRNLDDEQLLALKKNGGVVQTVAFASYVKVANPSPERVAALTALEKEFGLPDGSLRGRGGRGGGGGGRARGAGTPPANAASGAPPVTTGSGAAVIGATPPADTQRGGGQRGGGRGNALASLPEEKRAEAQRRLDEIDKKFPPPPRANVKDFVDHIDYIVKKIGIDHVGVSSDFDGGGGVDGWNDASETFDVTLELVRRGYTEEQIGKIWSGNLLRVLEQVQKLAQKS
jgi:membrane dipeptidase